MNHDELEPAPGVVRCEFCRAYMPDTPLVRDTHRRACIWTPSVPFLPWWSTSRHGSYLCLAVIVLGMAWLVYKEFAP